VNNIFTKLKDFVGISEQPEDEDETDYEEMNWEKSSPQDRGQNEEEDPLNRRQREPLNLSTATSMGLNRSNVIGMPGINNNNAEVVVVALMQLMVIKNASVRVFSYLPPAALKLAPFPELFTISPITRK